MSVVVSWAPRAVCSVPSTLPGEARRPSSPVRSTETDTPPSVRRVAGAQTGSPGLSSHRRPGAQPSVRKGGHTPPSRLSPAARVRGASARAGPPPRIAASPPGLSFSRTGPRPRNSCPSSRHPRKLAPDGPPPASRRQGETVQDRAQASDGTRTPGGIRKRALSDALPAASRQVSRARQLAAQKLKPPRRPRRDETVRKPRSGLSPLALGMVRRHHAIASPPSAVRPLRRRVPATCRIT